MPHTERIEHLSRWIVDTLTLLDACSEYVEAVHGRAPRPGAQKSVRAKETVAERAGWLLAVHVVSAYVVYAVS
jgi:hypothetical protein